MSEKLQCRMYENKFPEVNDLVVVTVKSIAEMGAYVSLLEYNNIEGMILLSELTRRRIRSISKLIRIGKQEVVAVLRVDKEKGYIDLSKRRVSPEDIQKCEEKYNKSKTVHSIMRYVAEITHSNLEDLYNSFGWPLYRKYGHAYDAFKVASTDPKIFDAFPDITEEIREALLKDIKRRMTPQAVKIRADFEVTCYHYEGISAIKEALRAGQDLDKTNIKIKLVAPPLFVMVTSSLDKEQGVQLLQKALDIIKETIQKYKGDFKVKVEPRAISEKDEHDLLQTMEELERQNKEVDGDDDASESDEEGIAVAENN